MSIISGNYYRFQSYSDGKYLNVYTSSTVTNNKNVTTYTLDTTDNCQIWKCISHSSGEMLLKTKQNESFSLDRYRGASNYNNADVYTTGTTTSDLNDQLVEFVSATSGYYRIKLVSTDLYLTVSSTATTGGHNVTWRTNTGNTDQLWLPHLYSSQSDNFISCNYLTYPTQYMRITQNHLGTASHLPCSSGTPADFPIDEACEDSGKSYMFCPCNEMEVKRIYGVGTSGTNTIWLRSTSPVVMPCGTDYVVMMVTHPEDDTLAGISIGDTFARGDQMFFEGMDGNATGNHFHISVGKGDILGNGWTCNSNGGWVLTTTNGTITAPNAFFVDNAFTTIVNSAGYTFSTIN